MSETDLSSIPLPSLAEMGKTSRKTAKEMLQEALKGAQRDKKDSLKESPSLHKSTFSSQPKTIEVETNNSNTMGKSSQSIVDELFKDFIAQKFNKTPNDQGFSEANKKTESSVDEISKLLDMEIISIQNNSEAKEVVEKNTSKPKVTEDKAHSAKHHHRVKSSKRSRSDKTVSESAPEKKAKKRNHSSSSKSLTVTKAKKLNIELDQNKEVLSLQENLTICQKEITDAKDKPKSNLLLEPCLSFSTASPNSKISSPPPSTLSMVPEVKLSSSSSTTQSEANGEKGASPKEPTAEDKDIPEDKAKTTPGLMLPTPLAKKQAIPKQLGLKLTSTSLSLIKSTDRVDQDGRVWEEGEVVSSHSENEQADSDSEPDGYPSETGSINSDAEEWRGQTTSKSKKKHKHKHKKKKKKSSSKDKEKKHKSSSEKSSSQGSKNDKHSEKRSSADRKSRERSRSKSREDSKRTKNKDSKDGEDRRRHLRSRSKSPKHRRSSHKSRSRSRSPKRSHYNEWDARHYSSKHRSRSRSRDRSSERSKRRSSSSGRHEERIKKETREERLQIDKAKLRRIAIANALVNMKAGQGPQVEVPALKSEGKSVQELTEFCKRIADKGKEGEGSDEVSDSSDDEVPRVSDDEETLIHHPFKIKEPVTTGIVMNIRNSKQLPVLTPLEKQAQKANLRLTFPVSSGSHHRANESEWVPVERPSPAAARPTPSAPATTQKAKPSPVVEPVAQVPLPEEPKKSDSIFPDPAETQNIDIGTIISERLQAVRKLQQNPYDVQALSTMHKAQEQASMWATSKHLPGQFTGSTGARVLSQAELIGDKRHQAWAKKTQLLQAAPVTGGIGMFLLQKMGWKHGEGLGKNNEGNKEPLLLDIKVDRKGLSAAVEAPQKKAQIGTVVRAKDLSNKHPVSALMELCNRRKWGPPVFTVVDESGPDHKKNFLFKVKINNIEYQPTVPSSNKKTAKAQCAGVCLQELGLIPRDAPLNI
ncbi:protein SON [Elysia marginata]|uniref:Protein SON n=1 Tax=Elysia marginata TaxID=1093978 RepID=A0AAV4J402_9GAST|nr:protein SON [Elysia marginata]